MGAAVSWAGCDALWMSMNSGWIVEAICLLDAVEAIEHRFNRDKSAMYAIERSLWRFGEPGGIVADPGWMIRRMRERMVDLVLLHCSA